MKFFKNTYHFLFGLLLVIMISPGCDKDDPTPPVIPDPPISKDPPQYETPFASIPATEEVVMYEINERAFSSSGTLMGILPRLDSIKALGVNVIWLMPIHPIGAINSVNSPYCVRNFTEVNPEYGNLENLRTLVREAHNRDMAVILDWVANHTSWDNPWIQNKSWYSQDANGNIIHPAGTNWQDVADLNFDNAAMRLEMIKALKYWVLAANIDGYRCDAADWVPFSFWKQAIDSLNLIPNRDLILLAEGARDDHFNAGFEMNFGWEFFDKNVNVFSNNHNAAGFYQAHQNEYNGIPSGKQILRFTSNHDKCAWEDTPLGMFGGKEASMSAFVINTFMGGVPLIYNGQEVGCPVKLPFFSRSPINWTTNPDMFAEYKWLMALRADHPAIHGGGLVYYSDPEIAAFKRMKGNDEVLILANTQDQSATFEIPTALVNTTWMEASTSESIVLENTLVLDGYEYLILMK